MGAYLRGKELEFNKRKYNQRETVTCNIFKRDKVWESSGIAGAALGNSSTVSLKLTPSKVYACSRLTAIDVEEIINPDMSKINFTVIGFILEVQNDDLQRYNYSVTLEDYPNVVRITTSYDTENFYISFIVNQSQKITLAGSQFTPYQIVGIVGYFTYDSKYLVSQGVSSNKVVYTNDVVALGHGISCHTASSFLTFTEYEDEVSGEENTTVYSDTSLPYLIGSTNTVYNLDYYFSTSYDDDEGNLNGSSAIVKNTAYKKKLTETINTMEITHVI